MWMTDMLSPKTFTRGVSEAENLMKSKLSGTADDTAMPFLDYFYLQCKNADSNLNHFINVLAVTGHVLFYFSEPDNIKNLYNLTCLDGSGADAKTAKKLAMKPDSKKLEEKFWPAALLTSALLHDLGKTLTHEKDPFHSVQHANRGYLLFIEAMHDKVSAERQTFTEFLVNAGFPGEPEHNYAARFCGVLQAAILFHDRFGVWMTAESGAAPAVETIDALAGTAEVLKLDYEKLAFTFFALTMSDVMASMPAPVNARSVLRFPNKNKPHPLRGVPPGHIDATEMIEDFLCSQKGVKTLGLLPVLLKRDAGYFLAEAAAGKRFYRMIANARTISQPWRAYLSDLNNLDLGLNNEFAAARRELIKRHFEKILRSAADARVNPDVAADEHVSGLFIKLIGDIEKTKKPGDSFIINALGSCADVLAALNICENDAAAAAFRYAASDLAALVDLAVDASIYDAARLCPEANDPPSEIKHIFDGFGVWDYSLDRFGAPFDGTMMAELMDRTPRNTSSLKKVVRLWVENMTLLLIDYYDKSRLDRENVINLEFKKHASPYAYVSPVMRL